MHRPALFYITIDLLRIATRHRVPGFGRQRVMALIENGMATITDVLTADRDRLVDLLADKTRTNALITALSDHFDPNTISYEHVHRELAQELGVEKKVIACNSVIGTDYEDAICELLREEPQWVVHQIDDGKRQNVLDILLSMGDEEILIECKTVTKKPPLIDKDAAWAVVQKSADFSDGLKRITLGKPDFDEHSKKKAAAASSITLVQHAVFMEGFMRVLTGRLSPKQFVNWLAQPGVTELSRLPGAPTYAEPERE